MTPEEEKSVQEQQKRDRKKKKKGGIGEGLAIAMSEVCPAAFFLLWIKGVGRFG